MSVLSRFDTPKYRKVSRWVFGFIPVVLTAPLWSHGYFVPAAVYCLYFAILNATMWYPWWSEESVEVRLKYLEWMPWYISGVQRPILLFMGKPRQLGKLSFTIGKVIMVSVATCFGLLMLFLLGLMLWDLAIHPASRKALEDRVGTDFDMMFILVSVKRLLVFCLIADIIYFALWKWIRYMEKKDRRRRASN